MTRQRPLRPTQNVFLVSNFVPDMDVSDGSIHGVDVVQDVVHHDKLTAVGRVDRPQMGPVIFLVFINNFSINTCPVNPANGVHRATEIVPSSWLPGLEEVVRSSIIGVTKCSAPSSLQPDLFLIGFFAPTKYLVTGHRDVGREKTNPGGADDILPGLYCGGASVSKKGAPSCKCKRGSCK